MFNGSFRTINEGFTEQNNKGSLTSDNKSMLKGDNPQFIQKLALCEHFPSVSKRDGLNAVLNSAEGAFFWLNLFNLVIALSFKYQRNEF